MTQNILKVENLNLSYQDQEILKNINLDLALGERVSILGESGSGKSSLLRCIAGFEAIDEGKIFLEDKMVSSDTFTLPTEKRRVGMVVQEKALFPHLSVKKNILFGIEKASNKNETVSELAELFKIENLLDKLPGQISGGEQQRVALARSLAPSPTLLMLDEPFSALDDELKQELYIELDKIFQKQQLSILLVTHDHEEAKTLTSKSLKLSQGSLITIT
ncbi:MAG: ATP-binding cassette domain-containing protein [Gammaproteobacteria bacterium]|nr:MAG: ATP-binding cassette domain-containing protein [Gammaproteobacteria bacterium]|tara:strand:+ start:1342 stop:1998 length:657 start_codon:yes stop_codon:yes gene_type:complete